MKKIKPLSSFKMNRKIPIKTKIEEIEYAKKINNASAAKIHGVTTKSKRRWKKIKQYLNQLIIQIKRLLFMDQKLKKNYLILN